MQIDWFTTGAQIVNFLILIALLKKFLYRPIIEAMAARERNLADQRRLLADRQAEAESLKSRYEASLQQIRSEKDKVLADARAQAEIERAGQLQRLSEEVRQKKSRFTEQLQKEQQELGITISRTIVEKALRLGGKILAELADQPLERRIVEHFLHQLSNLPEQEQAAIRQGRVVTVVSRFPLDETVRQRIAAWLDDASVARDIRFEQDERLICGIALETDGRSWDWNIERYLAELETDLLKPVNHERHP
ncbi:F0F1 ATP synthase subunit B family protein [Methylobacter sp. YRD-M1]|uniref:F0F1 ATP synthase subunit B family protein n=1 Tax=Methylobacter sp. YRD-M1 TaxID=2911520 RepID=UPI00227C266F|nr:hypothetical protein [Methylobacter sp. YRD-M1]WAK03932.1 hypothetical protein LZ558_09140 [Methylobacter sp. YRD-M1]